MCWESRTLRELFHEPRSSKEGRGSFFLINPYQPPQFIDLFLNIKLINIIILIKLILFIIVLQLYYYVEMDQAAHSPSSASSR